MKTLGFKAVESGKWVRPFKVFAVFITLFVFCSGKATADVKIPYPIVAMEGKSKTAVIVEKKTQTLFVFTVENGEVKSRKMICSTGKDHGDKKNADDKRTPEGVYFFKKKLKGKKVPKGFGALAFQLDYPNSLDGESQGNGKNLMFYGTDRELKPMNTDGGVAVESKDIRSLEDALSFDDTPFIVAEELTPCTEDNGKAALEGLDRFISQWAKSLSEGTYHEMLTHYSEDYMPDMTWWNTWQSIRKEALGHGNKLAVNISERSCFRESGVYAVIFRMNLGSEKYVADAGLRKLYVKVDQGVYKIIGDEVKPPMATGVYIQNPLISASKALCNEVKNECADAAKKEVLSTVNEWVEAWASGDIDRYGVFYANSFSSSGLNKKAWIDKKRRLSSVNKNIEIAIENPIIEIKKDMARARFRENYTSSGHSSKGIKTLVLMKEGAEGKWMIVKENWAKK